MRQRASYARAKRASFTLIEMLIVIAIIAVLLSLVSGAVIRYITTAQIKSTEATISKVSDELNRQYAEVIKRAATEPVCATANYLANGDPGIARVIHIKLRLKQEFPMSYFEALCPTYDSTNPNYYPKTNQLPFDPTLPPMREYQEKLAAAGITINYSNAAASTPLALPGWFPTQDENSACLAMALEHHRGGKGVNLDDLLGPGVAGKTGPPNQPNPANPVVPPPPSPPLPYPPLTTIKDSFGSPIVFYRWATGNPEVDASGSDVNSISASVPQRRDTQDPEGKLQSEPWWSDMTTNPSYRQQFEQICHSVSLNGTKHAYYMPPIVASSGVNQNLGIQPPIAGQPNAMSITDANAANDNLYSFRLRLGGKGD